MKSRKRRPIKIGILTAPMPMAQLDRAESYLDRDYVAWIEMSGANAVVIPYNTPTLGAYLARVHGVVLVGGAIENCATHNPRQYKTLVEAVRRIYAFGMSQRYFPIWGTCLGFDLLAMMGMHLHTNFFRKDHMQKEPKFSRAPIAFTGKSRLRAAFPLALQKQMARNPVATHMHRFGMDPQSDHVKGMRYLTIASVDTSDAGSPFVNMFEYKKFPFYGSQWHPEKPKSELAEAVSLKLSEFFKKECAKNKHAVPLWGRTFQTQPFKTQESVLIKGGQN